ncbi:hypothetical protein D3C81_2293130 [compost metagenome]
MFAVLRDAEIMQGVGKSTMMSFACPALTSFQNLERMQLSNLGPLPLLLGQLLLPLG